MAIQTYVNEAGKTLFLVYVNVRSKTNPAVRVQKRTKGLKTETEAKREETRLIREAERTVLEKESLGESWGAVVEAWEQFLASDTRSSLSDETKTDYIASLERHTRFWWPRPASSITKADVRECLAQMNADGVSISFQNKVKMIINRAFQFGIESNLITGIERSPTQGISLGRQEQKKPEILTISEIKKLLSEAKALDHPWYPVWAVAILTGMRNGELFALQWSDVNWEGKELSVTKSYNCRRRAIKSTKSGDWRTVPISSELESILSELKQRTGNSPFVLPRLPGWDLGYQARELRAYCAGIGLPSVKFHTLRACFATQLIRNGVPPIQIQKICGWKDLETMQRYIRLAGIEVSGVTESLRVLPAPQVLEKVGLAFANEAPKEPA